MIIYDFFSGTGSATKAFEDKGYRVVKVDIDPAFDADEFDIMELTSEYLIGKYGQPDFIWASPPCERFSIASTWRYWERNPDGAIPKDSSVLEAIELVKHTLKLIGELKPTAWLLENPRAMLRKQDFIQRYRRKTITYCQYGDTRQKPTDIWGYLPTWKPKPVCEPNASCHEASPRGSKKGVRGQKNAQIRAMIPYGLSLEICEAVENLRIEKPPTFGE